MPDGSLPDSSILSFFTNRRMPDGTYGGVRGRRPIRVAPYSIGILTCYLCETEYFEFGTGTENVSGQ